MNTLVKLISFIFLIFFVLLTYLYWSIFVPVNAVNYPVISEVVQGESLSLVSDKLYAQKIIKNKFIFENFIKLTGQDSKIQIGEYTYHKPLNMVEILNKLITGRYEYIPVIITIKEGEDSRTIVDKIYNNFKNVKSVYSKEELLSRTVSMSSNNFSKAKTAFSSCT